MRASLWSCPLKGNRRLTYATLIFFFNSSLDPYRPSLGARYHTSIAYSSATTSL